MRRLLRGIVAVCDFIAYHAVRAEVRALLYRVPRVQRWSEDGKRLCHLQGRLHSYERLVTGHKSVERARISAWMRAGAWDEQVGPPPNTPAA